MTRTSSAAGPAKAGFTVRTQSGSGVPSGRSLRSKLITCIVSNWRLSLSTEQHTRSMLWMGLQAQGLTHRYHVD